MFSEENQQVPMKHECQILLRIHLLFAVFPMFFNNYSDSSVYSQPLGKTPKPSRHTNHFGAPDATLGQPFRSPSGQVALMMRQPAAVAVATYFALFFAGGTP